MINHIMVREIQGKHQEYKVNKINQRVSEFSDALLNLKGAK